MSDYKDDAIWEAAQEAVLSRLTTATILAVPGVIELVLEEFNNAICEEYQNMEESEND